MGQEFPRSIVCLTEESVEILYALGAEHLIRGVSCFVERPAKAKLLPVVTTFTHANIAKITEINPDLAIGYSDVQKDLARDLTAQGVNLYISHHRSLEEILDYVLFLGRLVGREDRARALVLDLRARMQDIRRRGRGLRKKPRVYLEEWDEPMIAGSLWWSELVELCGGVDVFAGRARSRKAMERSVTAEDVRAARPDIMLACWCGKKVDLETVAKRDFAPGFIREVVPEIFLQPGIAPIVSGADVLLGLFEEWNEGA